MYGSKATGRFQELIEGSYREGNEVEYTVDRDGCMVEVTRPRYQVIAARESVKHAHNKTK